MLDLKLHEFTCPIHREELEKLSQEYENYWCKICNGFFKLVKGGIDQTAEVAYCPQHKHPMLCSPNQRGYYCEKCEKFWYMERLNPNFAGVAKRRNYGRYKE